jgi:hypothetical protein
MEIRQVTTRRGMRLFLRFSYIQSGITERPIPGKGA